MIIDGFIGAFVAWVNILVSIFPTGHAPDLALPSGVIIGYGWLNSILPVSESITALVWVLSVYGVVFAARLVITLLQWLHIIGGR